MNEEEKIELIERYIQDNLSPEKKALLEEKMNLDNAFREEVELHRKLEGFLNDQNQIKLHQILAEQRHDETIKNNSDQHFFYRLAAIITLLLGVAAVYWFSAERNSAEDLFLANYEPYPMVLNQRAGNGDNEAFNAAIEAYQSGDFENALVYFNQLIEQDTLVTMSKFYQGVIQLTLQNPAAAVAILEPVAEGENQLIKQQALWYLGLAYLQKQDSENAMITFRRLLQKGDYKQKEVDAILEHLD
jgi:TolA-binding protein